ncbi:MAG: acetyl-CoA carboxylase biotin carboxyl carrier protein [Phycisphaeraceae bacterium]|nr:acetyl-CoA carboxylase biotin carboxyl carrier protein [Phycisphaeraceae bacterium]
MVDLKTLRQLIKLMTDNDLSELDLEDKGGEKIRLKRGAPAPGSAPGGVPYLVAPPAASPAATSSGGGGGDDLGGLVEIQSPMVGTYFAAPSPDAEAFVTVGAKVGPETVVCIIEAMKVFNEVKAELSGTIQKVLVENGQAVEFGQPLYLVKP